MTSRSSSSSSTSVQMNEERLESNGISATMRCQKDKIYIDKLERELQNCYQEIDYLQDQLNLRSSQANFMGEQVHSLELKLSELEKLNNKMKLMENGLERSDSQYLVLTEELKYKEEELHRSILQVQRLEMNYLDSQCEIESLKLELNEMEQRIFESGEAISRLETESKNLELYGIDSSRSFFSQFEIQLEKLVEKMRINVVGAEIDELSLLDIRKEFESSDYLSNFEESLDPLLSKIAMISAYDQNIKDEMKKMRDQIQESEFLIKQIKEELLEEKRRAKEDSEDLTQEMAELRYQMKGMLDEEHKRRALIEQASIKRIKQLDEQLLKEQQKATSAMKRYHEAHELAERQYIEIKKLKNALEKLHSGEKCCKAQRIDSCTCGFCAVSSSKGPENENAESSKQNLIEWYSNSSNTDNGT